VKKRRDGEIGRSSMRDRECWLEELIFVDIRSWGRGYVLMYILYKGEEMYE